MKVIKKSFSIFATLIITITAILGCSFNAKAFNYTHGIMFNQYYRLRHAGTGYYLTMNSSSDSVSVICSLQARSVSNSRQIFYLSIDYNTNTYYFSPNTSTTGKVLSLQNNSDITNNQIILNTKIPADRQKWKIARTGYGYMITTYLGSTVLAPRSLGTTIGTTVATATYSNSAMCNWILEPAYSGTATYSVTASSVYESNVSEIINDLGVMGYSRYRANLPSSGEIRERFSNSRFNVIHGHGDAGFINLEQSDGSTVKLYSENALSDGVEYSASGYKSSYVILISCKSATASSDRCSMVSKVFASGAMCVTGFKNNVAGGEIYCSYLTDYLKAGYTVEGALAKADAEYSAADKENSACPANSNNRETYGFTNFSPSLS